jgi:hypothetical protein
MLHRPLFSQPVVDARWHHLWAGLVAGGDPLAYAPFFRAPLYPWTLGGLYSLTGPSVAAGAFLSALVAAATVAVLHRAALRVTGGRAAAAACAALWALWGTDVMVSTSLLIAPLYILLLLGAFHAAETGRRSSWALLGLAAAARPTALLALPAMARRARPGVLAAALLAAPISLVWAANALAGDPLTVLSSQGGVNLYIGNGPEADGITAFAPVPASANREPEDGLPYHDNVQTAARAGYLAAGGDPDAPPSRVSSWWAGRTLEAVAEDPVRWLGLEARKLLYLLSPVEVPGNYDPYYLRGLSPVLAALVWPPPVSGPMILLWLLVPGAVAVTLRGRAPGPALRALAWAGLLAAGVMAFFVTARLRLPLVPFLLLWAVACVRRAPRLSARLAPAGLAAGLLLSAVTAGDARRAGVNMEFYDGLAHWRAGRRGEARALFLEAVEEASGAEYDVNRTEAMYNLGVIAARSGRLEEAASWWRAVLQRQPGHAAAAAGLRALEGPGGGVDPYR